MTTHLAELLKDSAYRLDQFKPELIDKLESAISLKESGKKIAPYVSCMVRGKPIKLTPEEAVRQLYLLVLRDDMGYPISRMALEYEVTFGREKKRADICIFDKDKATTPYILVELKKPKLKDGKEQLKSYCNATGAPMGVWTNGQQISYYHRKDPNYFEDIPAIPSAHEKLSDILSERWTIDDLVKLDKLVNERKSLKDLILEMEDEVLANAGVDVRASSEAFAAGRLDAEHYQPRFAALLALIDATGHGAKLGDCLTENKRGKQPDYADAGLPVVNSKHVLRNDVRLDADNRLATFAVDDLLISQGDVLVNGTGVGTIGRTAAYLHECQAVPDNHVTILRPNKDLDPVYLSMFLNSIAGQFQVEQRLRGSSGQIELYPNDIAEFRVWVAPKALQQSIRKQVEHSFAQKQRATQLLDAAKRAVEIAIEDSEAAALAYLEAQK